MALAICVWKGTPQRSTKCKSEMAKAESLPFMCESVFFFYQRKIYICIKLGLFSHQQRLSLYWSPFLSKKQYVTANITITHTSLQHQSADGVKNQRETHRKYINLVFSLFHATLACKITKSPRLLLMNHNDAPFGHN